MAKHSDITRAFILEALSYYPDTGLFFWNVRPLHHFKNQTDCSKWNGRYSGTQAGTIHTDTKGYQNILISINNSKYQASMLAWVISYDEWPALYVDHNNCNSLDNRLLNLRLANKSQQASNRKTFKGQKYSKGVSKRKKNRWIAYINVNRSRNHLGTFDCPAAASLAYQIAADIHFGEFARSF